MEQTKRSYWHTITGRVKSISMLDKVETGTGMVGKCVSNLLIFFLAEVPRGYERSKELNDRYIVLDAITCQQSMHGERCVGQEIYCKART